MTVIAVLAAVAAGAALAEGDAPEVRGMSAVGAGTYGIDPEAVAGEVNPAPNEAQEELLGTQPQAKDAPRVRDLGTDDAERELERTEMGSEAGSPANLTETPGPGDVQTNVIPGAETEMGSQAGENPDPIAGSTE